MPETPSKPQTVVRLSNDQLKLLRQQMGRPFVQSGTTELQAGYMLGVQDTLLKLEEGFVVDR